MSVDSDEIQFESELTKIDSERANTIIIITYTSSNIIVAKKKKACISFKGKYDKKLGK